MCCINKKGKMLIYFGLFNGMIQICSQVISALLPPSFSNFALQSQLRELTNVVCFVLYVILLIMSIVFMAIDKKRTNNLSVHKASLIYSALYVFGVRGLAPLLLPITMLKYVIKDRKEKTCHEDATIGDLILLIVNIVACVVTIGGFLALTTGVLYKF